jgi:hypothetical protein
LVDSADIGTYHSVYFYVCCEGLRGWTSTWENEKQNWKEK